MAGPAPLTASLPSSLPAAAIDAGEYSHAWELAAVNRLDLNILVDYRWPAFLQRAGEFVAQVYSRRALQFCLFVCGGVDRCAGGCVGGGRVEGGALWRRCACAWLSSGELCLEPPASTVLAGAHHHDDQQIAVLLSLPRPVITIIPRSIFLGSQVSDDQDIADLRSSPISYPTTPIIVISNKKSTLFRYLMIRTLPTSFPPSHPRAPWLRAAPTLEPF